MDARTDIETRVKRILAGILAVDEAELRDCANLFYDLGACGNDQAAICMAIEEEFRVLVPERALKRIDTVGDTIRLVAALAGLCPVAGTPLAGTPAAAQVRTVLGTDMNNGGTLLMVLGTLLAVIGLAIAMLGLHPLSKG